MAQNFLKNGKVSLIITKINNFWTFVWKEWLSCKECSGGCRKCFKDINFRLWGTKSAYCTNLLLNYFPIFSALWTGVTLSFRAFKKPQWTWANGKTKYFPRIFLIWISRSFKKGASDNTISYFDHSFQSSDLWFILARDLGRSGQNKS